MSGVFPAAVGLVNGVCPPPCELESRQPPGVTFTWNSVGLSCLERQPASKDNAAAAKSRNGTSEAFSLMLQE